MCRRTIYCNECQIKNCAQNRPSIRTQIRTRVDGPLASHFHCFQIGTAAAKSSRFLELPFFFRLAFPTTVVFVVPRAADVITLPAASFPGRARNCC
jgi:hypothetical protein